MLNHIDPNLIHARREDFEARAVAWRVARDARTRRTTRSTRLAAHVSRLEPRRSNGSTGGARRLSTRQGRHPACFADGTSA